MSLTLKVCPRPLYGDEEEFAALWAQINADLLPEPVLPARKPGFMARLMGAKAPLSMEAARKRFVEVSMSALEGLNPPIVGKDKAANEWARSRLEMDGLEGAALNEAFRDMIGYPVLRLVPPSDGLPLYTNAQLDNDIDETSFAGDFLALAQDVLETETVLRADIPMRAEEAGKYGQLLMDKAYSYAEARGLENVIGNRQFPVFGDDSAASQVHIADQAGRWYVYWSEKGHGVDPVT